MDSVRYIVLEDERGVEFAWVPHESAEKYVLNLESKDREIQINVDRSCDANICHFTKEELPVGIVVWATVFSLQGNERTELHPPKECYVGGFKVALNIKAKLNPVNPARKIDVSFDKPLLSGISKYQVYAFPSRGGKHRMVETKSTTCTVSKLKSNTEYFIQVRPVYGFLQEEKILFGESLRVTTDTANSGVQGLGSLFNITNATARMQITESNFTVQSMPNQGRSPPEGRVRNLIASKDDANSVIAQWDVPSFADRSDDFSISHFLVESFTAGGKKLPTVTVPYEDGKLSFKAQCFVNPKPNLKYRIVVKTYFEEIDTEKDQVSDWTADYYRENSSSDATASSEPEEKQGSPATRQESILKQLKGKNLLKRCEFGEIYRIHDDYSGKERALMKMVIDNMAKPAVERLKDGLTSLKPLNHQRLLRSFSFVQEGQFLYIIRELFCGKTLQQCFKDDGSFGEEKAARFTIQILDGISYMHEKGLIHGDIRSKNILIDGDNIKINCSVPGKKETFALCSSSIPEPLNFFTPEQTHGHEETKAVDIWGVGCTVIEMITGFQPWNRAEPDTIVSSLEAFKGPPLPENITSNLKDFFEKTFAKLEHRPTSGRLLGHNWLTSLQGLKSDSHAALEIGTGDSRVEEEMQVGLVSEFTNPIGPDDFEEEGFLGRGSYGHVYVMTHSKSGKRYAVKRLNEEMENDYKDREDRKSIVLREVRLSTILHHQNLVACYGHYYQKPENKELCLVMELMKESLRAKVMRENGFDELTTKNYTRQILAGLQRLDEMGMVHRDIKTANILINAADEAKIADYGFLKEIGGEWNAEIDLSKPDPPGPMLWTSPELHNKKRYTRNTDIWSLGCTVVEMMTTNPPVTSVIDYHKIMKKNGQGMPILPDHNVTQGLKDFLKMIFVPKEDRPYAFQLCSRNPWF